MIDLPRAMDQYHLMRYRNPILRVTGNVHDDQKSHAGAHHDQPQGHHEITADHVSRSRAGYPFERSLREAHLFARDVDARTPERDLSGARSQPERSGSIGE